MQPDNMRTCVAKILVAIGAAAVVYGSLVLTAPSAAVGVGPPPKEPQRAVTCDCWAHHRSCLVRIRIDEKEGNVPHLWVARTAPCCVCARQRQRHVAATNSSTVVCWTREVVSLDIACGRTATLLLYRMGRWGNRVGPVCCALEHSRPCTGRIKR